MRGGGTPKRKRKRIPVLTFVTRPDCNSGLTDERPEGEREREESLKNDNILGRVWRRLSDKVTACLVID